MSTTLDHKAILRKNMVKLISDLRVDEHLLSIMLEARIISEGNAEDIRAETKKGNRNHEFVSIVGTRGENGLRTFIKGLVSTEQDPLADSLHKGLADMARKEAGVPAPGQTGTRVHAQETAGECELEFEQDTYHVTFEATVIVARKKSTIGEVTVQYATKNGTAKGGKCFGPGVHYISQSDTLTFKDGESSKEITISVDDDVLNVNETKVFSISLKNQSSGATLGENDTAAVHMTGENILDVCCKTVKEDEAKQLLQPTDVYKMKNSPKGLAVIINNKEFDVGTNLTFRGESLFDVENLTKLFGQLDFTCYTKENQTAQRMKDTFQKLSEDEKFEGYDALFVCIMSHGSGYHGIYGTDGRKIDAQEDIVQPFWSTKTLKDKPKVFLFQACREMMTGNPSKVAQPQEQEALGSSQVATAKSTLATDASPVVMDTRENNGKKIEDNRNIQKYTRENNEKKIEDNRNILKISSTVPGTVSFKENSGSWFIRSFVKVTAKYADREDLRNIMERVKSLMSRKVANQHLGGEYHERQAPEITDTGFQKLYLVPGYPQPPKSK